MDDDRFQERLDNEYADDQIGDAEGEVDIDEKGLISKDEFDDAIDEFIESQKIRDRKLYRQFNNSDEPPELVPIIKKRQGGPGMEAPEDPQVLEKERREIIQKSLAINDLIEKEYEEKGSSESESDDDEEDEEKFDCQSIISTYTNTDNHPAVIKTTKRVVQCRKDARIELHKQFKVPLDGLMAEEITVTKDKVNKTAAPSGQPFKEIEEDGDDAPSEEGG